MHIVSAASTPNASPLLTHQNSLQAYQTSFAPPSPFGGAGAIHSGANSMMHPTNAMGVHAFSKPALFPPPSPVHQGGTNTDICIHIYMYICIPLPLSFIRIYG
jgi:hypothetical protein